MFNQCSVCYNETTVAYLEKGRMLCPSCFTIEEYGGEGSGNFGHGGRPGEVGGSGEGGGSSSDDRASRGHIENLDESKVISQIAVDAKVSEHEALKYYSALQSYTSSYLNAADIREVQKGSLDKNNLDAVKKAKNNPDLVEKGVLIEEYIKKAPMYKGTIYRGIMSFSEDSTAKVNAIKALKVGDTINMKGLSSWTSSDVEAKQRGVGGIVFVSKDVKKSASIKHLSRFKDENEVLVSSEARFKISNIEVKKERMNPRTQTGAFFNTHFIEIKEI